MEMDQEEETAHVILEEERLEGSDETQVIDHVIPIRLVQKTGTNLEDINAAESSNSNITINNPNYATLVRGKYSKYYKQTYRKAWESMPDFKGWLQGVKGEPTRAYCTYCQKTLHAHRLSLLKHTCTIRHQRAAQIHSIEKNNSNHRSENHNEIQTVIVNDENILTEEEDGEFDHSEIIYTQEDHEYLDNQPEMGNELEDDFLEEEDPNVNVTQENAGSKNTQPKQAILSTEVTDMIKGAPVSSLSVSLYKLIDGRWTYINEGLTDSNGKFTDFIQKQKFGRYKLHYDVDRYFAARKQDSLYPFIEIVFDTTFSEKYHFPLLLSPTSYTTYISTA